MSRMSCMLSLKYYPALLCAVLLMSTSAEAIDNANHFLILGPGALPCTTIVSDLKTGIKKKDEAANVLYSHYLAGYLTAYNHDAKNTYSIMGATQFTEAFLWTAKYCEVHPGAIYASAVDAYIREMTPKRLKKMPDN